MTSNFQQSVRDYLQQQHRGARMVDVVGFLEAAGEEVGRICSYVRRLEGAGRVVQHRMADGPVYVWQG